VIDKKPQFAIKKRFLALQQKLLLQLLRCKEIQLGLKENPVTVRRRRSEKAIGVFPMGVLLSILSGSILFLETSIKPAGRERAG
jgi:hypothetical protein